MIKYGLRIVFTKNKTVQLHNSHVICTIFFYPESKKLIHRQDEEEIMLFKKLNLST